MKKALTLIAIVLLFAGCAHKKVMPTAPAKTDVMDRIIDKIADLNRAHELVMIHFDLDSDMLGVVARDILYQNSLEIKKYPGRTVLVEGHCDDRGTSSYNMALGEKRAQTVKTYYQYLGIDPALIQTVSYGEEIPYCMEKTDACYAMNRRAVSIIK